MSPRVWFGDVEAETMYRCQESMLCVVPEISRYTVQYSTQSCSMLCVVPEISRYTGEQLDWESFEGK